MYEFQKYPVKSNIFQKFFKASSSSSGIPDQLRSTNRFASNSKGYLYGVTEHGVNQKRATHFASQNLIIIIPAVPDGQEIKGC